MKPIKTTTNFTKFDAMNARNGNPLKNCDGLTIPVDRLAIGKDSMEDGEEREVCVIVSTDNECYTTISPTVIAMISDCIDLLEEGEKISVKIIKRTSSKGREFISLQTMPRE